MRAELDTSEMMGDFAKIHEQYPTLAEVARDDGAELFEQDYDPDFYKQSSFMRDEADPYHERRTNDFLRNVNNKNLARERLATDAVFKEFKYEGIALLFCVLGGICLALSCCAGNKNKIFTTVFFIIGVMFIVMAVSAAFKVVWIMRSEAAKVPIE